MKKYPQSQLFSPTLWKGKNLNLRWVRQFNQWLFFALWYYTFFRAYAVVDNLVIQDNPYPDIFLKTDPLAGLLSSTAARVFAHELMWWLPLLIISLFIGRGFCGWVCPLGTWIDFSDHIRNFWNKYVAKIKCRLIMNRKESFRKWMNIKFYILIAMIVASFFSVTFLGYLDPLCIMARTFAFSIRPWFGFMESTIGGQNWVFGYGFKLSHFFNYNIFAGVFFIGLLSLNHFYRRFWCRVLCPLGALLGVAGKVMPVKISVDPNTCTSCLKCVVDCKMGAIDFPETGKAIQNYRKEECIQCYICVDVCPHDSLKIHVTPNFWKETAVPFKNYWNSTPPPNKAKLNA